MKTLVYQSFRTKDVPTWISLCLDSVRRWAASSGFEYRFFDDAFFDLVPSRVRGAASAYICMLADYARLVAARDLLKEGWDRVIWFDADALIFAPEQFKISVENGYAFCREIWLDRIVLNQPQFNLVINNAVSVFCRDQAIIDFYLSAADSILLSGQKLKPTSIGTDFLTALRHSHAFPLMSDVGIFGVEMSERYLKNDGRFLGRYLAYQTSPVYAINLCLSKQSAKSARGKNSSPDQGPSLITLVERLLADEGASLNAWYEPTYSAKPTEFDHPLSLYIGARRAFRTVLERTLKR